MIIKNVGTIQQCDHQGNIINNANFAAIKSPWNNIVLDVLKFYLTYFPKDLHSLYIRGSVAQGTSIQNISDLDTIAIFSREIITTDIQILNVVKSILIENYKFVTDIELSVFSLDEILLNEEKKPSNFLIKTQGLLIYGKSVSNLIPNYKPNVELAQMLFLNLKPSIENTKIRLKEDHSQNYIEYVCRWIMKLIVRDAFLLIMPELGVYTRDLYPCAEFFTRYYPDYRSKMELALNYAINPITSKEKIVEVLDTLGCFILGEFQKKYYL